MNRTPLYVRLRAKQHSVVELTVADRVQLDRLIPSPLGCIAARHGGLLGPGTTTIALEPGHYRFKTLSDAHLRVVTGGVAAAVHAVGGKDPPPPPPLDTPPIAGDDPSSPWDIGRGDEAPGEPPRLTIEQAGAG